MNAIRTSVAAVAIVAVLLTTSSPRRRQSYDWRRCGRRSQWVKAHLLGPQAKMPFSFVYNGQPSDKLAGGLAEKTPGARDSTQGEAQHLLVWTDAKTGLGGPLPRLWNTPDYPAVE